MMNTIKAINDKALTKVTGGDYGDTLKYDFKHKRPLYKVGNIVEVYDNFFHTTTTRGKVVAVYKELYKDTLFYEASDSAFKYKIEFLSGGETCVFADDIQR